MFAGLRRHDEPGRLDTSSRASGIRRAAHRLCALNSVTTSAAATNTADGAGALQVTSRENIKIEIFGVVKLDAIYNEERPQAPGVPFFLVPKFAGGFTNHTFDINARQSLLGVLFTGPKIGNFQSGGRISAVFFDPSVVADRNGFLLQQSYGELFNDQLEVRRGSAIRCLRSGLADDAALFLLRWLGQPR